ncbi:MAG TPA: hypothetical protein VM659_28170, partial [Dongiaceae bacterium]|nr:hypothetical protein [Dongiaceae bacterium]
PFSSVGTVTNVNRGVGNAAVRVTIAADQDIDHVGEILKEIAKEMRKDDDYRRMMRSDLQLWGVDDVQPGAVTLAGQIVCSDAGRWGVQREFNRRMAKRFSELGIKLAAPSQYLVLARPMLINGTAEALDEAQAAAEKAAAARAAAPGEARPQPVPVSNVPGPKDKPAGKVEAGEKDESPASMRNSPPPSALGHTE